MYLRTILFGALVTMAVVYGTSFAMSPKVAPGNVEPKKARIDYVIRKGAAGDRDQLLALYKKVASTPGGLARTVEEITPEYIDKSLNNALHKGLIFVAEYQGKIIGSVLKYQPEPKVFAHVFSDGSILVDSDYQGQGIGTALFEAVFKEVKENRRDILRIEIVARESNSAINLYKKLGFVEEGRKKRGIRGLKGLEDDVLMAWFNPNYNGQY